MRRISPPRAWPYAPKWCLLGVCIGAVAGVGAIALYGLLQLATELLLAGIARSARLGSRAVARRGRGYCWWCPPGVGRGRAGALARAGGGRARHRRGHRRRAPPSQGHPRQVPYVKLLASVITIGSGGSGGTEGPVAQISGAFGSVLSRAFGLSDADARVAVSAGLAAGVGAIFRAPFGGALLGGEILYRHDIEKAMLLPSMIASTVAYLEFGAVFGFTPMFGHTAAGHRFGRPGDLAIFALTGVLVGLLGRAYAWSFYRTTTWFSHRRRLPGILRPALGGLVVGALGLAVPGALGTGYGTVKLDLDRHALLGMSLWLVVAMPLAKSSRPRCRSGRAGRAACSGRGW